MLQTLFFIPSRIYGIPTFGIGWAFLAWCVVSLILIGYQARRTGFNEETRGLISVLGIFALAIVFVLPRIQQPEGLPIRGYGTFVLVAVIAGLADARRRARRMGINPDTILSLAFWIFVGGIVGARAFFVIQKWDQFAAQSAGELALNILSITEGGLVVYGSLIGALVTGLLFVLRHKLPPLAMGDLIAPSFALGLAIGRLGCLMNGCCFGNLCDYAWAITFPRYSTYTESESPPYLQQHMLGLLHGFRISANKVGQPKIEEILDSMPLPESARPRIGDVLTNINSHRVKDLPHAYQLLATTDKQISLVTANGNTYRWSTSPLPKRSLPTHPTQIYSSVNALLLFAFLAVYYPFRRRDGEVFALMMTIYSLTRFLLEMIRTDEAAIFGSGMTISQNVSVLVLVGLVGMWIYLFLRPREAVFEVSAAD